ncbi:hypothetical protein PF003_g28638 [Phytophthora fragariae]|nr:hypothetical protein PF003_g28638 [Phytophthora fragariae]
MVLFFYGVYFCHVAASGYMLVAHWECGLEFTRCERTPNSSGCWVLRDRLEKGSRFRQYVRTLYWACKTVVTLGQGDLIPVTLVETTYRIVVQFFAGLWVTAILTAYTFFFTHKDANLTSNISTRLDQAVHVSLCWTECQCVQRLNSHSRFEFVVPASSKGPDATRCIC